MLGMGSNREMDQGTWEEKECPPFPSSQSPIKFTLLCSLIFLGCLPCLVPRPHFSSQPKRFGSRGPCKNVRPFPARSPRISHRNKLTEMDWDNAVQGLGNCLPWYLLFSSLGSLVLDLLHHELAAKSWDLPVRVYRLFIIWLASWVAKERQT